MKAFHLNQTLIFVQGREIRRNIHKSIMEIDWF